MPPADRLDNLIVAERLAGFGGHERDDIRTLELARNAGKLKRTMIASSLSEARPAHARWPRRGCS